MSANVIEITDADFDAQVLKSPVPVLLDFWAPWCGPCRQIAPVLEELGGEFSGRIKIAKINIDENSNTPSEYGVRSIPTLIIFKNGVVAEQKIGALSKGALKTFIETNIA